MVFQSLPPLKLPLALYGPRRELLHADPKSAFTRFDSREDAEHAVQRARRQNPGVDPEQYVILPVRSWLNDIESRESKITRREGRSPVPPEE